MSLINVGNENGNINAVFIFEIIGKPKEYLTEALSNIIGEIDKENGINVIEKKINEPIVLKDQEDFFTTFAEVEVEAEKIMDMIVLMFKYMPAHVEVTNPGEISLSNNSWSEVLSELTRRLHAYDEVARIMQTEKGILEKKLRELLEQNQPKSENTEKPKKSEKKTTAKDRKSETKAKKSETKKAKKKK